MKALILAAALALAAGEEPVAPYEVVRAGDRAMSCEALIAEINALNAEITAQQTRQAEAMSESVKDAMGSVGGGAAGGVASSLASMVPFGSQALSIGRQAQQAAAQRKMTDQIAAVQQDAITMGPKYQRLDHLMELYDGKAC